MGKPEIVVTERELLAGMAAGRLAALMRAAIAERGRVSLALTGGSVAPAVYPALAAARLDWSRVLLFWGDERAVLPDDPESNYRLARDYLIDRLPAAPAVYRMEGERRDLAAAARDYDRTLTGVLGVPPRLDVVLLGVGPDGHVCSLFPGHQALREPAPWVLAVHDAPKPPPRRLTLSLSTLGEAHHAVVVAFGGTKRAALRGALQDPASTLPVALVARRTAAPVFILDRTAEP